MATSTYNITLTLPSYNLRYSVDVFVDSSTNIFIISCEATRMYTTPYTIYNHLKIMLTQFSSIIIKSGSICTFECSKHTIGSKKLYVQPPDLSAQHLGLPLNNTETLQKKLLDFITYDFDKWFTLQLSLISMDDTPMVSAIEIGDSIPHSTSTLIRIMESHEDDDDDDEDDKWKSMFQSHNLSFGTNITYYSSAEW